MEARFLLVRKGCPFCLEYLKAVNKVNLRLPLDRRIKIVDGFEWEEFGILPHPIMEKFDREEFTGYPFLYMSGIIFGPGKAEQLQKMLTKFLEEEFII